MNRHRVVEVLLGRPHAHRHRKPLQHLVRARAHDVQADDALLGARGHELHLAAPLGRAEGVIQGHEAGSEHRDAVGAVALAGRLFGEPDGADRRTAENHRRNVLVIQVPVALSAKQPVRQPPARRDRHRCELRAPRHVPDGINSGRAARLVGVGGDEALDIERHPGLGERQVLHHRHPSDRPQHAIERAQSPAVARGELERAAGAARQRRGRGVRDDLHALLAQHVERRLAEHVVEGLQRRVAAQHQRGAGPEAGENAGELDGDVTAAHNRDAPWALGELEEAVGGDAELGAGNQGPARPPTGGEDDVRGLQAAPGGRDRVLIEEARPGAYQLDLVARQVRGVRLVQLEDVGVAPLLEQGPVVPGDL